MKGPSILTMLGVVGLMLAGCGTVPGFHRALAPNVCRDLTVSIYFDRDSAVLTRESRAVLNGAGELARGCALGQVDVLGLADAVGDPDVNLDLSKRRADAVRASVARMGFQIVNINVGAIGEQGAVTPGGLEKPLRRRAEVTFHLRPR